MISKTLTSGCFWCKGFLPGRLSIPCCCSAIMQVLGYKLHSIQATHLPFWRYSAKRFCVAVALSTIRHIKLNHQLCRITREGILRSPERVLAGRASVLEDACDPNESLRLRLVWSSGEGMVSCSFREEDQPEFADGALPCAKPRDASGSDVRSLRIMCICEWAN